MPVPKISSHEKPVEMNISYEKIVSNSKFDKLKLQMFCSRQN